MKFRLTSVRESDGKELTHVYDNVRNRIETEEGIPVCLEYDPRIEMMLAAGREGERKVAPTNDDALVVDETLLKREDVEKCLRERRNLIVTYGSSKSSPETVFYGRAVRMMRLFLKRNREEGLGLTLRIRMRVTPLTCRLRKLPQKFQYHLGAEKPVDVEIEGIVAYDTDAADRILEFDMAALTRLTQAVRNLDALGKPMEVHGVREAVDVVFRRLARERDVFRVAELEGRTDETTGKNPVLEHLQNPQGSRCACQGCPFLISCLGGDPALSDEAHAMACGTLRYWHMALFIAAWFRIFGSNLQEIEPMEDAQ